MILSVIIPAYNELATIVPCLERVLAVDLGDLGLDIIVVDDGSTDETAWLAECMGPRVRVIKHTRNRGKGAAIQTGLAAATGILCLVQDADLEYDPADYKALLEPLLERRCALVIGSRFRHAKPKFRGPDKSPFLSHWIGNRLIIALTNLLYRAHFTDYEACYKVFWRALLVQMPVEAEGFSWENELVCKALRTKRRVEEVPVSYTPRSYAEGKKITWRDGLTILWTILKWRVWPIR